MNDIIEYQSEPEGLEEFKEGLALWDQKRSMLLDWIRDSLVEGTDYGRIHVVGKNRCQAGANCTDPTHFSKPSLWKAGAEKIAGMLQLRAEWPELVEELKSVKQGATIITLRCVLTRNGEIVSEGVGARDVKSDYGDPNKALKMAKKSSMIDAVLNAAGLSEVFTQDLSSEERPQGNVDPLTDEGIDFLWGTAKDLFGDDAQKILESLARRRFRLTDGDWKQIPDARLSDAIRSLEEKASG